MGLGTFIIHRFVEFLVIILIILYMPNMPPNATFSKSFKVTPARPLEGKLALNNRLNDVEMWHKGDLLGPEAFEERDGIIYTSVHGGDVVKLVGNHITPVVKFGKPCKGWYQEAICGRPLGMDFGLDGYLYVCDAYYGIFKVDVKTGNKIKLVDMREEIGGRKVTLPNSIAVAKNGDFFWTDSSTEFQLYDGLFDMLADGSGRLIHYDAKTKRNRVLIDQMHFSNGVILSNDESFVLVSETGLNRIHRYYLKGPKQNTHDIFIDGLPGLPDNLNSDGKNGFIIPLVMSVDQDNPCLFQTFGPFPLIRKFVARTFGLIELAFKLINKVYPCEFAERGVHFVGHFTIGDFVKPKRTTIVHLSETGEILDSIHTLNKNISSISEAFIFRDTLYLGSPHNDYIGRISLDKIGWGHLKQFSSSPKPTTTTPKPTRTTPRATTIPKSTTTTPKPTTTTTKPATTTPKPTATTPKPTTTTPEPTTITSKPTATTPKPTTTTPEPTTTTPKLNATTPKPITTTPKPTTTTPKPTTTTPKPTTTTPKPTTTTPKPTTTTPKPTTTTPKPTTATPQTTISTPKQEATPPKPNPSKKSQAVPTPTQAKPVKEQSKTVPVKESPITK